MICWKIRIFAYWTTPLSSAASCWCSCDLLKNSYLCLLNNTNIKGVVRYCMLWFAEKFVSLLIEQHQLCWEASERIVVICWKIRIFAYWTTPGTLDASETETLWFAEKFVSLLIEQHPQQLAGFCVLRCDLLKNSYLCLLNNTLASI